MTKTGWIIFATAVIVGLGGLIAWTRITNPPLDVSSVETATILAASAESGDIADRAKGNVESKVVLIEHGDFQCPGCGSVAPHVQTLMSEYGDKIAFVFRNFPLTSIHPNAKAAAAVAEAAGLQGKYWEMHNHLFSSQSEWSNADVKTRTDIFNSYAESLGLDLEKFTSDIAGTQVAQKLKFDAALGKKSGVTGTPAFFIGSEQVDDETTNSFISGDTAKIKELLDAKLK